MWEDVVLFAAVGVAAQVVDGALGMAYGVTATTVLLSLGVAPPVASASVHAAEVFTTGASGAAHWRLGNVDRALFRRFAIAGVCGGILGAYLLTFLPAAVIRPLVSGYLLIMGGLILWRAIRGPSKRQGSSPHGPPLRYVGPLGLVLGGVLAAPFAALVTRKVPDRPLMLLVGAVIVLLSLRGLLQALG